MPKTLIEEWVKQGKFNSLRNKVIRLEKQPAITNFFKKPPRPRPCEIPCLVAIRTVVYPPLEGDTEEKLWEQIYHLMPGFNAQELVQMTQVN